MAMSRIRNRAGATPLSVQKFLLDLLRYNDNSNNAVSTLKRRMILAGK